MIQALPLLPISTGPQVENIGLVDSQETSHICHAKIVAGITKDDQAQPEKAFANVR